MFIMSISEHKTLISRKNKMLDETEVEFTIKVKMRRRWVSHFCSMLNYMEQLGNLGSSRKVGMFSDGDGDFRPKFKIDIPYKLVEPIDGEESGNHIYDAG